MLESRVDGLIGKSLPTELWCGERRESCLGRRILLIPFLRKTQVFIFHRKLLQLPAVLSHIETKDLFGRGTLRGTMKPASSSSRRSTRRLRF